MRFTKWSVPALCALVLATVSPAAEPIPVSGLLVLDRLGTGGRTPLQTDPVEYSIAKGIWTSPTAGEEVSVGEAAASWRAVEAGENGRFSDRSLRGGWGFAAVEAEAPGPYILRARGHRSVYVNGEPRVGDVYDLGITRVPVTLHAGRNTLLFRGGRGSLSATLYPAEHPVFFESRDATLPDVIRGEPGALLAGVFLTNATEEWRHGLRVRATLGDGKPTTGDAPLMPPMSARKIAVSFVAGAGAAADERTLRVELIDESGDAVHAVDLRLRVRDPADTAKRTFLSGIDRSVQYYGVTPPPPGGADPPALYLALHGASVEGLRQAAGYKPKAEGVVVAPTNRRPFGFDWEDWGRLDALEVIGLAADRYGTDPARAYVTGHSMGGHGTWSLGAMFAPRFAAIGPSAGWRDFWAYGGGARFAGDPVSQLLDRAANASRTLLMKQNYAGLGVYVLHGDADETVRVDQARYMREQLAAFHTNFAYYERPGAGHWWGDQCMDWPPMFEFFRRNTRPPSSAFAAVDFTTVDPGISADAGWITIDRQQTSREPSRVTGQVGDDAVTLTTDNIEALTIDLSGREPPAPATLRIDGAELRADTSGPVHLARDSGAWTLRDPGGEHLKSPQRNGPFKDAFRNAMLYVVGTAGSAEETAWAMNKARYDAETFWYRGNGSIEIVTDEAFLAAPDREPHRNIVLLGNADTNAAWTAVLGDAPIDARRGRLAVGDRSLTGDELGCLFVAPREGSPTAAVAVISGTGLPGFRTLTQAPYFVSGVHYPDWFVTSPEQLRDGIGGVLGCGFFDHDWSVGDDATWR